MHMAGVAAVAQPWTPADSCRAWPWRRRPKRWTACWQAGPPWSRKPGGSQAGVFWKRKKNLASHDPSDQDRLVDEFRTRILGRW